MSVAPADVKKLRDKTGAGMLDCKKALQETNGDFAEAEVFLKKQGLASADKKMGRATSEGAVFYKVTSSKAVLVELTCETDFVAKTDKYKELGNNLATLVLEQGITQTDDERIVNLVKEGISILNENLQVKKIVALDLSENQVATAYLHNEGSIAALVVLDCGAVTAESRPEIEELGFGLALHIAAFNPAYLKREDVASDYIEQQTAIFTEQSKDLAGKPANVIENIIKGKVNKHLSQICLLEQGFVKEDKTAVKNIILQVAKKLNTSLELSHFEYISVGAE